MRCLLGLCRHLHASICLRNFELPSRFPFFESFEWVRNSLKPVAKSATTRRLFRERSCRGCWPHRRRRRRRPIPLHHRQTCFKTKTFDYEKTLLLRPFVIVFWCLCLKKKSHENGFKLQVSVLTHSRSNKVRSLSPAFLFRFVEGKEVKIVLPSTLISYIVVRRNLSVQD